MGFAGQPRSIVLATFNSSIAWLGSLRSSATAAWDFLFAFHSNLMRSDNRA